MLFKGNITYSIQFMHCNKGHRLVSTIVYGDVVDGLQNVDCKQQLSYILSVL